MAQDRLEIEAVKKRLRAKGLLCESRYVDSGNESREDASEVDEELLKAVFTVFVFSSAANQSASAYATVFSLFDHGNPPLPFLIEDIPYSKKLKFCLGSIQHIRAFEDYERSIDCLLSAVLKHLDPKTAKPKRPCWPRWCFSVAFVVIAGVAWWLWRQNRDASFVLKLEPVLAPAVAGVCSDCASMTKDGRLQIVMLDCITGDYAALERFFANGKVVEIDRDKARKNAVLETYAVNRLMIPILAATAMRYCGVSRNVALGENDWRESDVAGLNRMLGEKPLESGLSALHLSTALQGRGVSPDARRYAATPYHLLQGLLGIVGEAHGGVGFDYCGGVDNARAILAKMKYEDGFGLLTGAVLCEADPQTVGKQRRSCNVAGALGYKDPFCMLFVRLEASSTDEDFDVSAEALSIWNAVGLLAKAADEKWEGRR